MVHNPRQLIGMQTRVDRVQYAPRTGHAVIKFEVAITVPSQRADPRGLRNGHRIERIGDAFGATIDFGIVGSMNIAFDAARNDFGVGVISRGEFNDAGNHQRMVLHQALHGSSFWVHIGAAGITNRAF